MVNSIGNVLILNYAASGSATPRPAGISPSSPPALYPRQTYAPQVTFTPCSEHPARSRQVPLLRHSHLNRIDGRKMLYQERPAFPLVETMENLA